MSSPRRPGLSVRLKLSLSYMGLLMVAGALLLAVVWVFLLRYVPENAIRIPLQGPPNHGRPGSLTIFIPGRGDLWQAFAPKAAIAMAVLLVVGWVGGWILAGRVLAPLTQLAEATRMAGTGALSYRIHLPGRRDEFRDLADSFDNMLAQIEANVDEQRRFAANASHELRTPLAITQSLLEVARSDPDRDPEELIGALTSINARAVRMTEALLTLSRAERQGFTPERLDLTLLVEEALETLLDQAERSQVDLQVSGEVAHVMGSRALLGQMIVNLIQNAIVHNLPGPGSAQITWTSDPTTVTLTVANTGEELPEEVIPRLTEPFLRAGDRLYSDAGGVGLGLAIVASIVRAHDGSLSLAARPGGGLSVKVCLPRAPERSHRSPRMWEDGGEPRGQRCRQVPTALLTRERNHHDCNRPVD